MKISTKFIYDDNNVRVIRFNEDNTLDSLTPNIYSINHSPITGFYLSILKDKLTVPDKLYGNLTKRVDKCIHTYKSKTSSTGILLTGDKGTGKSLMLSLISNQALTELKLPVLVINEAYRGEEFNTFLSNIGECVIVIDEFAKMYPDSKEYDINQNSLLSLFDGIDKTKKMFILSENSEFDISEFFINRPSRIHYHFKYTKLDEASIQDYCIDQDVSVDFTNSVIEVSRRMLQFSFDILQAIVDEHQRFDESVEDILLDLNISSSKANQVVLKVKKIIKDGVECDIYGPTIVEEESCIRFVEPGSTDEDSYKPELYLDNSDIVYNANKTRIYEMGSFKVVTEVIDTLKTDYKKYF